MDIWGVLALLFAGSFFAVLLVALFYWRLVRPRLLALSAQPASTPVEVENLQATLQALNENLVRHSALIAQLPTSFSVRAGADTADPALIASLQTMQDEQTTALRRLEQALAPADNDDPLAEVPAIASESTLDEVRTLITTLNEGSTNINAALEQQYTALAALVERQDHDAAALQALRDEMSNFVSRRQATTSLQDIKGIGPVYAGRLADAGINSFEQLVQRSPDEIRSIVRVSGGLRINPESWLEQAQAILIQRTDD